MTNVKSYVVNPHVRVKTQGMLAITAGTVTNETPVVAVNASKAFAVMGISEVMIIIQ